MEKNKFLKMASTIFMVLAWLVAAIAGVIVPIAILITGGTPDIPRIASLVWLFIGAYQFLMLMTISCVLKLLIEMAGKSKTSSSI